MCRLYLKRGEVVDVPQPTSCSIVVAETCEKLSGVLQSQLETVADWLLAAFQDSELQFLNILHDQPMSKAGPCSRFC